MKVHIIGPNLLDQSKGSFHVHAEGCADMKRSPRVYDWRGGRGEHAGDIKTPVEVESMQDIVEYCYADQLDEGDYDGWRDLDNDFHVLPCVKGLPDQTQGQKQADAAR
jgi:hypothetical protein